MSEVKSKERPMLFGTPMVKAILDGHKSMTRRVLKVQPEWVDSKNPMVSSGWSYVNPKSSQKLSSYPNAKDFGEALAGVIKCSYGQIGDRLWVRETWSTHACFDDVKPKDLTVRSVHYWANGLVQTGKKRPSIFMPRWACRILLEITEIRVERLNQISREEAVKEGLLKLPATGRYVINQGDQYFGMASNNPCEVFEWLWESINGEGSWATNPWVWVICFKKLEQTA